MHSEQKRRIDPADDKDEVSEDDEVYNQTHASEVPVNDTMIGEAVIENASKPVTQKEIDAAYAIQHIYRQYLQAKPKREKRRKIAKSVVPRESVGYKRSYNSALIFASSLLVSQCL